MCAGKLLLISFLPVCDSPEFTDRVDKANFEEWVQKDRDRERAFSNLNILSVMRREPSP